MKNRFFSIILVLFLALTLSCSFFYGCGSGSQTTDDGTGSVTGGGDAGGGDAGEGDAGGGSGDTIAPTVTATNPVNDATDISNDQAVTNLTITFSENVNGINATTFTVADRNGTLLAGTVTYAANTANFAPTSRLALNRQYTARVSSAITDDAGNALGADYTWSFTTRTGSWVGSAERDHDSGNAQSPQVAIDNSANASLIWTENTLGNDHVFASQFNVVDDSVNHAADWLDFFAANHTVPQIVASNTGNVLAVWRRGLDNIFAEVLEGVWEGNPATNIEATAGNTTTPQIASSGNDGIGVWVRGGRIWANFYDASGSGWTAGNATAIDVGVVLDSSSPQVGMDSAGNSIVVWVEDGHVYQNILSNNIGTWTTAHALNNIISNPALLAAASSPQIAVNDDGYAFVVWVQDGDLYYNSYINGVWTGFTQISDSGTNDLPQVAMNNNGQAIVVFEQGLRVRAQVFNPAVAATNIDDGSVPPAQNPQIAIDAAGNAIAVWVMDSRIWQGRFNVNNNSWSAASTIDNAGDGLSASPQVAMDTNGNAIVVWIQNNNVYSNILR
ncbi:MAG: Ig-like domain-containing protein [Pseudomonadota bacterium]